MKIVKMVVLPFFFMVLVTAVLAENTNDKGMERRVYDGVEWFPEHNKHLVKLKIIDIHRKKFKPVKIVPSLCSGSIISERWILSAAHCFSDFTTYTFVLHQCGDELREIAKGVSVVMLPDFDKENFDYNKDIALLKTRKSIKFDKQVAPIKLVKRSIKLGRLAIIAGFGDAEEEYSKPRQGIVKIDRCSDPENIEMICSENVVRAGRGDSGGPLVYKDMLVGVTSAGCGDVHISKPCMTYYVDVARNRKWITDITGIE